MPSSSTIFELSNLILLLLLSLRLGNVFCQEESGDDDAKSTTEITAGGQINFGPAAAAVPTTTSSGTMGTRRGTPTSGTTYRQSRRHYGNVRLVYVTALVSLVSVLFINF